MKNKLLLPHRFQFIGLLIFIPGFIAGIAILFFDWEWDFLQVNLPQWLWGIGEGLFNSKGNNLTDELALSLTMIGLLLICFSAEKSEDEFIKHTRLESLQWALLINYVILFAATWLVFNDGYWYVIILSMLTIPLIFIIRFRWMLYRNNLQSELP